MGLAVAYFDTNSKPPEGIGETFPVFLQPPHLAISSPSPPSTPLKVNVHVRRAKCFGSGRRRLCLQLTDRLRSVNDRRFTWTVIRRGLRTTRKESAGSTNTIGREGEREGERERGERQSTRQFLWMVCVSYVTPHTTTNFPLTLQRKQDTQGNETRVKHREAKLNHQFRNRPKILRLQTSSVV